MITFINVIGGIIIGVAQQDLSFGEAAETYTILTVGDGLVTQIPALIVSTGAGLLVSKSTATGSMDKALIGQLGGYPRALGLSSFLMLSLALLPGIPAVPFLALAGLAGAGAWFASRKKTDAAAAEAEAAAAKSAVPVAEEPIANALQIDQVRLERSEEHTSELQSLMRISYAVFCSKNKHQIQH